MSMVWGVFEKGILEEFFNKTLLMLIPKVVGPELITQFIPISLYTVPYKVLTKVIMNWLKKLMLILVVENQMSFVGGRLIKDNIIVAQEVINAM